LKEGDIFKRKTKNGRRARKQEKIPVLEIEQQAGQI
jgi:hypothetical protein